MVQYEDGIHFDACALGQCGNTHGGARRIGCLEIFRHYLIDQGKMSQISEKNIQLGNIGQTAASRLCNSSQITNTRRTWASIFPCTRWDSINF